ncbi:unnamed protein product [Microthlaspi erraticum]|uniref:Uncharacterized protein n=1 Tax=Microthlaspi erraticum TaxID=1685480 RepID=A0A6D2JCP4_9BRAS|nr:unnamed protein product [Microthlaspi erraticum]
MRLSRPLYRETAAKPCRAAGRGIMFRGRPKSKLSVQAPAEYTSRPGKQCPAVGQATTTQDDAAHDHAVRAGKQRLAAARPNSRTTADGAVQAGKPRLASGQETLTNPSPVRPQQPTTNSSGHDQSGIGKGRPDPAIKFLAPLPGTNSHLQALARELIWRRIHKSLPYKGDPLRHIPPQRDLLTNKRCQALKHHHLLGIVLQNYLLEDKKKLLPYLEAADLETSSQAASYREEHLLATPEEEIDPELIEFVKRDQFHDLFSEYALEHIDHFDNLCDSYGVFDFEKKMMLFSTSLAGPALDWAQHEPLLQSSHGSILEKLS